MPNIGQRYTSTVPWLLRVIVSSAIMALIIGGIIGAIAHRSPFWKIDAIVFAVLIVIEAVFRFAQDRTNK